MQHIPDDHERNVYLEFEDVRKYSRRSIVVRHIRRDEFRHNSERFLERSRSIQVADRS